MHGIPSHPAVESYVVELRSNEWGSDDLLVKIATRQSESTLTADLESQFRASIRVVPRIAFESREALDKVVFSGVNRKPVRVVDLRGYVGDFEYGIRQVGAVALAHIAAKFA